MEALQEELGATHESGKPKYTPAMKCDIVCAQLQYRRDCLSRCLTPGAMCSQFKGAPCERLKQLLKNFTVVCSDESALPSLLKPLCIRRKYMSHMFATVLRAQLDRDRNAVTMAMTEAFLAAYDGGVFKGWRCTVDYTLSHPLNPEALIGKRVAKLFDGVEYPGTIVSFKKWWKILYEDGDSEELNYRELQKLVDPPDCSGLEYEAPAKEFDAFMRASGGRTALDNPAWKTGEPNVYVYFGASTMVLHLGISC